MKPRHSLRAIALAAGRTLPALLPSWARRAAASMFGPAETALPNCTPGGRDHVAGTPQATVGNDGRGVARSGTAAPTGAGSNCTAINWFGSLSGSIDSSVNVSGAFEHGIGFNAQTEGTGQALPATGARPGAGTARSPGRFGARIHAPSADGVFIEVNSPC